MEYKWLNGTKNLDSNIYLCDETGKVLGYIIDGCTYKCILGVSVLGYYITIEDAKKAMEKAYVENSKPKHSLKL